MADGNIDSDVLKTLTDLANSGINGATLKNLTDAINGLTRTLGGDPTKISQSSNRLFGNGGASNNFRNNFNNRNGNSNNMGFFDRFEYELINDIRKAYKQSNFGKRLTTNMVGLAELMGTDVKGIPDAFAKELEKQLFESLKGVTINGKTVGSILEMAGGKLESSLGMLGGNPELISAIKEMGNARKLLESAQTPEARASAESAMEAAKTAFEGAGGMKGLISAATQAAPVILAVTLAVKNDLIPAVEHVTKTFGRVNELGGKLSKLGLDGDSISKGVGRLLGGKMGEDMVDFINHPLTWAVNKLLTPVDMILDLLDNSGIGAVIGDISDLVGIFKKTFTRYYDQNAKNLELAQKRIEEDIKSIVEAPFKILEEAANTVQQTWDANLQLITSTQLYDKSQTQDLMRDFAQRLQNEGLSNYISGTDILGNLTKVLQQGLSGAVAEEFAYQATLLNEAIPTQDFFQFGATYSSIAANAIADGKSQSEAIAEANKSLKDFANNLLYSSRVLSGGFSTGLTNASSLYQQSVQIAQAANSGNISGISGVLTAVSGIIGAVAPDLANSIVGKVVDTALGGNDSSLVALRSLAGGNASNTEFLRNLATNPQQVFYNLFKTLDNMFTDSADAYMEKAEGYAQLFGLSKESFQRVDWSYLADAIKSMNTQSNELSKNITLLTSGQTTLTKEQQVNQQINKYLIDEGLSYVLDNEVARSIQEHMWQEQIARELQNATYGVELQGSALKFLNDINMAIIRIVNFLNPFKKQTNALIGFSSVQEAFAQHEDLKNILELGKVGQGNSTAYHNLTTVNQKLDLISKYVELLGGQSADWGFAGHTGLGTAFKYGGAILDGSMDDKLTSFSSTLLGYGKSVLSNVGSVAKDTWDKLSSLAGSVANTALDIGVKGLKIASSPLAAVGDVLVDKLNDFVSSNDSVIDNFIKKGKSYEDWIKSAGFDVSNALSYTGKDDSVLRNYYADLEMQVGRETQDARNQLEETFWNSGNTFWNTSFLELFGNPVISFMGNGITMFDTYAISTGISWSSLLGSVEGIGTTVNTNFGPLVNQVSGMNGMIASNWNTLITQVSGIDAVLKNYVKEFTDYFINHSVYYSGKLTSDDVRRIQAEEKGETGTAIIRLAEALTSNSENLTDPVAQTNALLAQILLVATNILNNGSKAGNQMLGETMRELSVGFVRKV